MRSILLLVWTLCVLFSMADAAPVPGPLSPKDALDRSLSHRLSIAKENLKAQLVHHSSENSSVLDTSHHLEQPNSQSESKSTAAEGPRAPGLVVQGQGQAKQDQDRRVWEKRFTEKEAWDAASWIWG
ncbi:hypothetical protein IAT40_006070 [Kwoniella sp. CBS 6097]